MATKSLPLNKTIVTEFKVSVADIYMRSKQMNGSMSARVGQNQNFISADANVDQIQKVLISNVQSVIIVNSYDPILISLKNETGSIENIPCKGLFVMYASFDEVEIKSASAEKMVRISYLYA